MRVVADCNMCREHKDVSEFVKIINGKQYIVHICTDCENWMKEVLYDVKELYIKEYCEKCFNYNIGDGVDDIRECCGCKYYIDL